MRSLQVLQSKLALLFVLMVDLFLLILTWNTFGLFFFLCGLNNRCLFSPSWKLEVQDQGAHCGWVLGRTVYLPGRRLATFLLCPHRAERTPSGISSSYKDTNPMD